MTGQASLMTFKQYHEQVYPNTLSLGKFGNEDQGDAVLLHFIG